MLRLQQSKIFRNGTYGPKKKNFNWNHKKTVETQPAHVPGPADGPPDTGSLAARANRGESVAMHRSHSRRSADCEPALLVRTDE